MVVSYGLATGFKQNWHAITPCTLPPASCCFCSTRRTPEHANPTEECDFVSACPSTTALL